MNRHSSQWFPSRGPRLLARFGSLIVWIAASAVAGPAAAELKPLSYNHPGLQVDLGVGLWAWPLPMDFDGDGDLDLVVNCPDKPSGGVYFFENAAGDTAEHSMPVFRPGKRISRALQNVQVSYVDGQPRVLSPGKIYPDFLNSGLKSPKDLPLPANIHPGKTRANMWRVVDFDGDGTRDIIAGVGDWSDYGWDDAYDQQGNWQNGPLRGFVYVARNVGTNERPEYAEPRKVTAGGAPVEVFGWPSPNFADFDGDGDLDLLCGEFLDGFTYFENRGTRREPRYAPGVRLDGADGRPLVMDLQMITPTAIDWDRDGDLDLIVGDEDGRVALVKNTGKLSEGNTPVFRSPRYFQQQADDLKFGALATPHGIDWDGDGDDDILSGNTAGYIGLFENLSGPGVEEPKWAAPRRLKADGQTIRIMAGPNGSIQGPAEAKWGYTTLTAADWDQDGLPDLLVNSIWGKVVWYRNLGPRENPRLAAAEPIEVRWEGEQPKLAYGWLRPEGDALLTQWRTTPVAVDWDRDGLCDLVMLDHEGYLAWFRRQRRDDQLVLLPPRRVFCDPDGEPLRLNSGQAGSSGRRKICLVDWDRDGARDILVNSENATLLRQAAHRDGQWLFEDTGLLSERKISGHTTSPTVIDLNSNHVPDLLVGAEDGRFYYMKNGATGKAAEPALPPVAQPGEGGYLSGELIYPLDDKPTSQCHASTLAETPTGLVAAWFGGTREKNSDVGIWISRHDGQGWTEPVEVVDGSEGEDQEYACWNPVLFQPRSGPLMLFYKVGPSPSRWWGMLSTSTDGGRSWSGSVKLGEDPALGEANPNLIGPVKNKPVQLPSGAILCPSSTEHQGWRVHFELTRDLGKSWEVIGPIHDASQFNAIQPSILTHGDGRLQVLCRSREGVLVQSWSKDEGKSWGPVTATALPNPNSGTDAVTLADGRHLLVYNHTTRGGEFPSGRNMLNVAVSKDGRTWQPVMTLEKAPGEYSYPAVIQAADGRVHISYTWNRESIKHVVLDPAATDRTGGKPSPSPPHAAAPENAR